MSQRELCRRIGRSKNSVSALERGKSAPTVETLRALCYALEVPPEQLLGMARLRVASGEASRRAMLLADRLEQANAAASALPSLLQALQDAQAEVKALREALARADRG